MLESEGPSRVALPRETSRWLHSLQLSVHPSNLRRDFSSGFLVAEIFSRYYSQEEFSLLAYSRGTTLAARQRNWSQIEKFLEKQNVSLRKEAVEGTMHCKPGAAEQLLQQIYVLLTRRSLAEVGAPESDFSDRRYQARLPPLARSTASSAIKTNLTLTEIQANPDVTTNQRRAQEILRRHLEQRAAERLRLPGGRSSPSCEVSCKEIKVRQPAKGSMKL